MPPSKRRNKGKQAVSEPSDVAMTEENEKGPENDNKDDDDNTGNVETEQVPKEEKGDTSDGTPLTPPTTTSPPTPVRDPLVLTSGKRRGVYECDYCHSDISQVPRVQCAQCPEFDLCLDCFATTDHSAAIARLKARGQVHDAVVSTTKSGVSAAAAHHEQSHGYRVADSTRYPLFPSIRSVMKARTSPGLVPMEEDEDDTSGDDKGSTQEKQLEKSESPPQETDKMEKEQKQVGPGKVPEGGGETPEVMDIDEETKSETINQDPKDEAHSEGQGKPIVSSPSQESRDDAVPTKEDDKSKIVSTSDLMVASEDPKSVWTVEEDLRLLDAIESCGMGNWADIAEAIAGNGSSNKTPKRCMERYFDDFLGRYGHILPRYTFVEEESDSEGDSDGNAVVDETKSDTDIARSAKRRRTERSMFRTNSVISTTNAQTMKKAKVVRTSSLPGYDKVWPDPYLPPISNVEVGQEVGRDQAMRAENLFVKAVGNAVNKAEADKLRKEWMGKRLKEIHGPTVLPPRPDDIAEMPGAELAGYMPRRGDFDLEWDNDAETILADMEFSPSDLPQDRQLKIQVIEIYNSKLDERERRKQFLLSRNLMDYRKNQQADQQLPRDERDLVRRMRLFERLHTPEEHKQFITDLLKAKRLRKEIAKLQMYRRMGIRSLAEAERYELDKARREYHKFAQLQKEEEVEKAKAAAARAAAAKDASAGVATGSGPTGTGAGDYDSSTPSSSLWKQYKTSDRKNRRSINRGSSSLSNSSAPSATAESRAEPAMKGINEEGVRATNSGENSPPTEKDKPQEGEEKKASPNVNLSPADDTEPSVPNAKPTNNSDDESKAPSSVTFNIANSRGYDLLSPKEVGLCERLQLLPAHYLEIKKALIQESLSHGLLDREGKGSNKRTIVKIDAEKRGDVVDFMVRAGWISTKMGASGLTGTV